MSEENPTPPSEEIPPEQLVHQHVPQTVPDTTPQPGQQIVSEIECSICGRDGGPVAECELCRGNQRFVQSRSFTLTEERQGKNPNDDRYSRTGDVSPKIVNLPGSWNPRGDQ